MFNIIFLYLSTSQEEMPSILISRPQTGLSFLAPEPEDLEDLYTRYKVLCFTCLKPAGSYTLQWNKAEVQIKVYISNVCSVNLTDSESALETRQKHIQSFILKYQIFKFIKQINPSLVRVKC